MPGDELSIGVGDLVVYADAVHKQNGDGRTYAVVRKVAGQSPHVELQIAEPGDIVLEGDQLKISRDPSGAKKLRVPWVGLCNIGDSPRWNFIS